MRVEYTVPTVGPGYATPGTDYATLTGFVDFPRGQTSVDVPVRPVNDSDPEVMEEVTVVLKARQAYAVGRADKYGQPGGSATAWITDNDDVGRIGGVVWDDTNANGIKDANEPGRAGITVDVLDENEYSIRRVTTDGNGAYLATGLVAGAYEVSFTRPANMVPTLQDRGADEARDSDADLSTGTDFVTLTPQAMTSLQVGAGFRVATPPPTPAGPTVVLTDSFGTPVPAGGALKIAKWATAFEDPPVLGDTARARLKARDAYGLDFIDFDFDRFNVRVYDRAKWDDPAVQTIEATLETKNHPAGYTAYNDDDTPSGWSRWHRTSDGTGGSCRTRKSSFPP